MGEGRLAGKTAIVVGAGQTPGETVGNGRATALLFAREGARVLAADLDVTSAVETVGMITDAGGEATPIRVDVTVEADIRAMVSAAVERWGHVDILHNNVGVSLAGGDAPATEIESEAFRRITAINLEGMVLACKHVLPVMRQQRSGAIINIASVAAIANYPYVAYRTSKAGVIALTEQLAVANAEYGIRVNTILPGLMNTPMAIESRVGRNGMSRSDVIAERDARVPLRGKMGTGWDIANAARFLASDEASFITGARLVVDGGRSLVGG